jgi:uncharacterized protein YkwD
MLRAPRSPRPPHPGARLRLVPLVIVTVLVALITLVAPAAPAGASDASDYVSRVNAVRAGVGLAPLQVDGELTAGCQAWAQHMADTDKLAHAPDITAGISQYWLKVGENVGVGPNVPTVMAAFVASPPHYRNIVDPDFNRIGVGVAYVGGRQYTCHRFMQVAGSNPGPSPSPAPAPRPAPPSGTTPTTSPNGGGSTPTPSPPTPGAPTTPAPPPATPARVAEVLAALRILAG